MRPARFITKFCALLALAAFANAQAMVCCVIPMRMAGTGAEAPMAADHSCCKKAATLPGEQACSAEVAGQGCGGPAESTALYSAFFASDAGAMLPAPDRFPALSPEISGVTGSKAPPHDTGPPRFLELRRLLI